MKQQVAEDLHSLPRKRACEIWTCGYGSTLSIMDGFALNMTAEMWCVCGYGRSWLRRPHVRQLPWCRCMPLPDAKHRPSRTPGVGRSPSRPTSMLEWRAGPVTIDPSGIVFKETTRPRLRQMWATLATTESQGSTSCLRCFGGPSNPKDSTWSSTATTTLPRTLAYTLIASAQWIRRTWSHAPRPSSLTQCPGLFWALCFPWLKGPGLGKRFKNQT